MKKQCLALVAIFFLACMPATSSAEVTVGDVAYKVAAGFGGVFFGCVAIKASVATVSLAVAAPVITGTALILGRSGEVLVVAPILGAGIVALGAIAGGSGYLSYRCFQEMLAPIATQKPVAA